MPKAVSLDYGRTLCVMRNPLQPTLILLIAAILLCLVTMPVQAQTHYIPEPFMRDWLNGMAPGCVDVDGFLDPNHPGLDTVVSVSLTPNCLDLTGVEYLYHLRDLSIYCMGAGIITPTLPDSLERLTVGGFGFTSPLLLPPALRYFNSWNSWHWSGLLAGPLPTTLDTLLYENSNGDMTIQMMPLPDGLRYLALHGHRINGLTSIPSTVRTFRLYTDSAICLPPLPAELDAFDVNATALTCIPGIPNVVDPAQLIIPPTIPNCDAMSACGAAVMGSLWHDANGNAVQDAGEVPLYGDAVLVEPGGLVSVRPDGEWGLLVDPGSYSLTPVPSNPYVTNISPAQLITFVTADEPLNSLNNFSYELIPDITDVRLDMVTFAPAPGQMNNVYLTLTNVGTRVATGSMAFQAGPNVIVHGTQPIGTEVVPNTIEWSFQDLGIGEVRNHVVTIMVNTDAVTGDTIVYFAQVNTDMPDFNPADNVALTNGLTVAPVDPNDKLVAPDRATPGQGADGLELTYTIRFQNTGNYHASYVLITDTLSGLLDPLSFRHINSSHACSWSVVQGVLDYQFQPIFLPDSTTDPLGSRGFVKFSIRTLPGLLPGDEIANTANIYFDYNEPVVTAPATFQVATVASIDTPWRNVRVLVAPNPTDGFIEVSLGGSWKGDVQLAVIDPMGRRVIHSMHGKTRRTLDLSGYAAGLLAIEASDGHHRDVVRLVKY